MSHDLSKKPELAGLSRVIRALETVAGPMNVTFFVMGAAARDFVLTHIHGIPAARATEDVDFGVMVTDWPAYEALRESLIRSGEFSARPGPAAHRLMHRDGLPLDIVPFGGVERPDRTLAWPPGGAEVFDCFGMQEARDQCITVILPGDVTVAVASAPAQVVLKIAAWQDRKHTHPGRDARDLFLFLRHYMDLGNLDRVAIGHADLFDVEPFDLEQAGVRLLARDIAGFLEPAELERILRIVVEEADEDGRLLLASQSGYDLAWARRMLEVLSDELAGLCAPGQAAPSD